MVGRYFNAEPMLGNRFLLIIIIKTIILLLIFKAIISALVPSAIVNLLSLSLLSIVFFASLNQKALSKCRLVLLALLSFVLLKAVYDLIYPPYGVLPIFTLRSAVQLSFPLVFIFILDGLTLSTIYKIYKYVRFIAIFLCIVGIFEALLIPVDIRDSIAKYILVAKVGENVSLSAYADRLFGFSWSRSGSLTFEPLSLASISVIMLIAEVSLFKRKSWISVGILFLGLVSAGAKSALVTLITAIGTRLFGLVVLPIYIFSMLALLLLNSEKVVDLFNGIRVDAFESISNHIIGLIMGIYNTFDSPWLGHGLGTAGYINWISAENLGIEGPFKDSDGGLRGLLNGNESSLGVITYQMGIPYSIMLITIAMKVFADFLKTRKSLSRL